MRDGGVGSCRGVVNGRSKRTRAGMKIANEQPT